MSPDLALPDLLPEARRQVEICNACRYCEGYCSVFPAMFSERTFSDGDLTQLANLCHNCRGCYYACQFTAPHEFALNIPKVLAEVRVESWERFVPFPALGRLFHRHGVATGGALVLGLAAILLVLQFFAARNGAGFYAVLAHSTMVAIFVPAFVLPLGVVAVGLHRYWRAVGGTRLTPSHLRSALTDAAQMKNLKGGHGDGCNFERADRFTQARRHAHQAAMWGFLLCFAATSTGTVLHYGFGIEAPYALVSLPKLFGISGGVLLVTGCILLAWLKTRSDPDLGAPAVWGGEMAFVLLLGLTGLTGLILYAATGTPAVPPLLALHLGAVLAFFVTLPWSKMVHGFFRLAALSRDAQRSQR